MPRGIGAAMRQKAAAEGQSDLRAGQSVSGHHAGGICGVRPSNRSESVAGVLEQRTKVRSPRLIDQTNSQENLDAINFLRSAIKSSNRSIPHKVGSLGMRCKFK